LELNWHLPVADDGALGLKRFLVNKFDHNDISTYRLTFGVKSNYGVDFTSIVIYKNPTPKVTEGFNIRPTYSVLHAERFNPNRRNYITYAQAIDKQDLPHILIELSQLYYAQLGQKEEEENTENTAVVVKVPVAINAYQCVHCLTIYDSRFGDEVNSIAPSLPFEQLPDTFICSVCEAPKSTFVKLGELKNQGI